MRDLLLVVVHFIVTLARCLRSNGVRSIVAESLLLKQQMLISNRDRRRAPNLTTLDRFVLGLTTLFISPHRIPTLSVVIKPATLLKWHRALVRRKYRSLFSSSHAGRKPRPKGPSPEFIAAILEVKARNPRFGSQRIAQQLASDFSIELDKGVVRRVLEKHYCPNGSGSNGPSWLTVFAHAKDSL